MSNFESQNAIEEMRNTIGKQENLQNIYKEVVSPSEYSNQSYFSPSHSQMVVDRDKVLINKYSNLLTTQPMGMTQVWKSNGLIIITIIIRFLYTLKLQTESMKYKLLNKRIFAMIQDLSSDYLNIVRYRNNKYQIKGRSELRVHYSLFKKQFRALLDYYGRFVPIFQPDQKLIIYYELCLIVSIMANLFYVPINISFLNQGVSIPFDTIPTILQLIWIFISFNLSFYEDQTLQKNRINIASNYLKSQFTLDFIIVFTLYFQILYGYFIPLISFVLRIPKLIRLLDQFEYNTNFKENLAAIIDLMKLIVMLIFIIHCCACSWHFLGVYEKEYYIIGKNWLDYYDISHQSWIEQYIASLYFSVITTLTVGYGDITPQSTYEQLFVIFVAMSLCGMLGYTITNIGEIYRSMNEKKRQYKTQMKAIEQIIRQRNLNDKLSIKVRKYYQHLFQQEQQENSQGELLLTKLTRNLEEEVMIDTYKTTLLNSYLLRQFKESTIEQLCTKVRVQKLQPGVELIKAQQFADQLIFLLSGELTLLGHNSRQPIILKQLTQGTVIGEQEFTEQGFYDYIVLSQGYSKIATISRNAFYEILQYDRQEFEKMCKIRDQYKFSVKKRNVIGRTCEICGWTHGYMQCPMTFYQVDKMKLLTKYRQNNEQERKYLNDFRRIHKYNTLSQLQTAQNACLDFMISQKILDEIPNQELNDDSNYKLKLNIHDADSQHLDSSKSLQDDTKGNQANIQKSPIKNTTTKFQFFSKQIDQQRDQLQHPLFQRKNIKKHSLIIDNPNNTKKEDDLKNYIEELIQKLSVNQKEKEREKSVISTQNKILTYNPDLEFEVMQSYKYYFPHFNIDNIIDRVNVTYEKFMQQNKKNPIRIFVNRRKLKRRIIIKE
ncbi:unnamed protein product [Paramecium pentaurelia]|uniref:Cyclic nucleotide-binding domain-containing protein n=1 Tax=Paramecium pentaurelia TaxID=43138 RepID=A0A8S1VYI4_9CILI|nr:unnamed protein product [Paramecium pentaurelia]